MAKIFWIFIALFFTLLMIACGFGVILFSGTPVAALMMLIATLACFAFSFVAMGNAERC